MVHFWFYNLCTPQMQTLSLQLLTNKFTIIHSCKRCAYFSEYRCSPFVDFIDAVDAAKGADGVFMVMGLDGSIDSEGKDRASHSCNLADHSAIDLPGCQHDLVSAIEEVNDNIVLILLNAGSLTIVEEDQSDKVRATVEAFYPGSLGGTAVTAVLFGEVSPAGRMPVMVVESDKDVPPSVDYNMTTDP